MRGVFIAMTLHPKDHILLISPELPIAGIKSGKEGDLFGPCLAVTDVNMSAVLDVPATSDPVYDEVYLHFGRRVRSSHLWKTVVLGLLAVPGRKLFLLAGQRDVMEVEVLLERAKLPGEMLPRLIRKYYKDGHAPQAIQYLVAKHASSTSRLAKAVAKQPYDPFGR